MKERKGRPKKGGGVDEPKREVIVEDLEKGKDGEGKCEKSQNNQGTNYYEKETGKKLDERGPEENIWLLTHNPTTSQSPSLGNRNHWNHWNLFSTIAFNLLYTQLMTAEF